MIRIDSQTKPRHVLRAIAWRLIGRPRCSFSAAVCVLVVAGMAASAGGQDIAGAATVSGAQAGDAPPPHRTLDDPADLQAIADALRQRPDAAVVQAALPNLLESAREDRSPIEALPVIEQAADILQPTTADGPAGSAAVILLKTAARLRYDQADPVRAEQHLTRLLSLYRASSQHQRAAAGDANRWARHLVEVASEFLRGGHTAQALDVLGEAADLGVPSEKTLDDARGHAAAALNRRLETLSTEARFNTLRDWIMPTEARRTVRVWTSLTPAEAPPSAMARALGERPRSNAFPVPQINGVFSLFSAEWQLVDAAEQSGHLRRLTADLDELAQQQVPGAAYVLLLARIRGSSEEVDAALLGDLSRMPRPGQPAPDNAPAVLLPAATDGVSDVLARTVIATACLRRPWLQPLAKQSLQQLCDATRLGEAQKLHPLLQRAVAVAVQQAHQSARTDLLEDPDLRLWTPAIVRQGTQGVTGPTSGTWAVHEGHVLRLPGAGDGYLLFRYPLAGDFELQAEVQVNTMSGDTGRMVFGGLAGGPTASTDAVGLATIGSRFSLQRSFPFVHRESWPTYQRLAVTVSGDEMTWRINGHRVWTDRVPHGGSPWLGVGVPGNASTVFRNFQLTGNAVIPSMIRLADGAQLSGWYEGSSDGAPSSPAAQMAPITAGVRLQPLMIQPFEDKPLTPNPLATSRINVSPTDGAGWSVHDGMIYGAASAAHRQRRLTYFRPLQEGEAISYEFLHEAGRHSVHPALGRIAFLIQPAGVQIRWLTDGDGDWTGLPAANAVTEPLARRGPRQLPLAAGDWNRMTVMLQDGTVTLTLNDTTIYTRPMDDAPSSTFAFYYDPSRSAARVRNVVMRGPWPQRLTDAERARLLTTDGPERTPADRQALGDLFADRHIDDSALTVHRQAMAMPVEPRYAFLSQWVLPGPDHATLRLSLDFTPTHPAPPVADKDPWDQQRLAIAAQAGWSRVPTGGNLISPALDLIAAADQLGRLDEVRQRVEQTPAYDPYHQRARLAMLAMIDIASEQFEPAVESLFELFSATEAADHTAFAQRLPETLATHVALLHPETFAAGRELAYFLFLRQARNGTDSGSEAWRRHVIALAGLARLLDIETQATDAGMDAAEAVAGGTPVSEDNVDAANVREIDDLVARFTAPPSLHQWHSVSRWSARTRGQGFPNAHWQLTDDGPTNLASHDHDYLFFQSPLQGDYEVQAEVPAFGWRDTQLFVSGVWTGLIHTRDTYEFGNVRTTSARQSMPQPISKVGRWLSYRAAVRDGHLTTYVNGRQLHQQPLPAPPFPWLAIRTPRENGAARNVRIAGQPEIPGEVRLSAAPSMDGWIPYHDSHGIGGSQSSWHWSGNVDNGGGIRGVRRGQWAGMHHESLLRYHRPMLENGTIEYDFFYRRGSIMCHPALDRLAFLLDPSGVRIHWITDGAFDRTDLPPDNAVVETGDGAPAAPLPLKPDQWNRLGLTLDGDTVHLILNGRPIYQRTLESTNQRTFGLFHYSDHTEAHVRDVIWRGDWPRSLPPLAQQELSGDVVEFLDRPLADLPATFEHDFAASGMPNDQFSVVNGDVPHHVRAETDGLHLQRQGADGFRNVIVAPRLSVGGDFDVTITYEQLITQASTSGSAALILMAMFDDPASQESMLYRRQNRSDTGFEEQFLQTAVVRYEEGVAQRHYSAAVPFEANAGKLRLVRRGDVVYMLAAEEDSSLFRLLRTQQITSDDVALDGIRVMLQIKGPGFGSAVLKSISVRAESLSGQALEESDETVAKLDRQRAALPERFEHDFTRDRFTAARFYHWSLSPAVRPEPRGQRVTQPGWNDWRSAGVNLHVAAAGDFDVALEFDIIKLDVPQAGDSSAIYLQLEFPGPEQLQCNVITKRTPEGTLQAVAQVRTKQADDSFQYPTLRQDQAETVRRMRLARRGAELLFLYAEDPAQPDRLLTRYDVPDGPLADGAIRLMVHTGGAGRVTTVDWKRLSVHAAEMVHP